MTTLTLHSHVQRRRFADHLWAALWKLTPSAWWASWRMPPARTQAELASRQAQAVRHLARAHARTDPGFAADLYAAAARHEGRWED